MLVVEPKTGSKATIYRDDDRGKDIYIITFYSEGQRQRIVRRDFEDAFKLAQQVVVELGDGGQDVLPLWGKERRVYENALDLLRPTGLSLDAAAAQLVEAMKILGGMASLKEAAELTKRHRPRVANNVTVQAVVDELLEAKEADGVTKLHLRDLRTRLNRFAKAHQCPIVYITTQEVEKFLRSLGVSKRTRKNFLTTIGTLLHYAKAQGYLPDDHPGVSKVAKLRKEPPNIGILTPDEMTKLLAAAKGEVRVALLLGGFAGLRSAEIVRLDWDCIKVEEGHIEVPARCAKTGIRRLPPITDNLREWLRLHQRSSGPVCAYKNLPNQWLKLAKQVGVQWKRNALRHSFISYRVAITKNIPQTALEAGNSVTIIQQHYLKMVTEQKGKEWFAIVPTCPDNVITLPAAATPQPPIETPANTATVT